MLGKCYDCANRLAEQLNGRVKRNLTGPAVSASMSVSRISALAAELNNEAIKKFGKGTVHRANAANLKKIQGFLQSHPKYSELMNHLKQLPKSLLPKGDRMPPKFRNYPIACHFRRHVSLPLKHFDRPTAYVSRLAKQLNGRVQMFNGAGRAFTWYIPAALGLANVAMAPPEMRMRTLFEEGFGIVGGAVGTWLGSTAVATGAVGFLAICGLCLGPFGIGVIVFLCASAGGYMGMELFKTGGAEIYDYGAQLGNGPIYHSPEQFLEGI